MARPAREPRTGRRPGRPAGRRPGGADTRTVILEAARAAFGEAGYDGASMRDVAARAGVDPALLYHYFGSKQRLFVAAMELPYDWRALVARLSGLSPADAGEQLVRFMLELWESPSTRPLLFGLVRSMTTDPTAASMVREILVEGPVAAMAAASEAPDMALRVQLAAAQVMGLALVRYVIGVEPVASAPADDLVQAVGPIVARYLAGHLDIVPSPTATSGVRPARRAPAGRSPSPGEPDRAAAPAARSGRRPAGSRPDR